MTVTCVQSDCKTLMKVDKRLYVLERGRVVFEERKLITISCLECFIPYSFWMDGVDLVIWWISTRTVRTNFEPGASISRMQCLAMQYIQGVWAEESDFSLCRKKLCIFPVVYRYELPGPAWPGWIDRANFSTNMRCFPIAKSSAYVMDVVKRLFTRFMKSSS